MVKRRDLLKAGLAAGASGLFVAGKARGDEAHRRLTRFLCSPDDRARELDDQPPSPEAEPFVTPLFIPPVMQPLPPDQPLNPPPDPRAHQRYEDFLPKRFYEIREREFRWKYHANAKYSAAGGSWSWGWEGWDYKSNKPLFNDQFAGRGPSTPGPTYHARYGDPAFVRLFNGLPEVGRANVSFALPSTTTHLHNGHTASESDGNPQDWVQPGEFWDHHYGNFPSGFDPREKLTTLWYHDHRLDFTAANVYAGLAGFYLLFDEDDTGNELTGWRLPSGEFDIPLLLQDIRFTEIRHPNGASEVGAVFDNWNTDGMLGDKMTVNRRISPMYTVKRRKYRIRLLNGGPSRFYQLGMFASTDGRKWPECDLAQENFTILTGDGNFLPEPVEAKEIYLSVAQRVDVVVDFSKFKPGQRVYVLNRLEQLNGAGPTGRLFEPENALPIVCFEIGAEAEDPSRIPEQLRPLPKIDLTEVKRTRTWTFDYDGGLWTINGRVMDPNRIDAGIDQGSAEIWIFRNGGNDWAHPVHSHFTEFLILEVNGKPYRPSFIQSGEDEDPRFIEYLGRKSREPIEIFMGGPRRDVATLLPGDEIKVFMRWKDFLGKHVMHCHNVVHEDHAMMIRWDIMEPGRGFDQPRETSEVYGQEEYRPPFPDDRPPSLPHQEDRPSNPTIQDG